MHRKKAIKRTLLIMGIAISSYAQGDTQLPVLEAIPYKAITQDQGNSTKAVPGQWVTSKSPVVAKLPPGPSEAFKSTMVTLQPTWAFGVGPNNRVGMPYLLRERLLIVDFSDDTPGEIFDIQSHDDGNFSLLSVRNKRYIKVNPSKHYRFTLGAGASTALPELDNAHKFTLVGSDSHPGIAIRSLLNDCFWGLNARFAVSHDCLWGLVEECASSPPRGGILAAVESSSVSPYSCRDSIVVTPVYNFNIIPVSQRVSAFLELDSASRGYRVGLENKTNKRIPHARFLIYTPQGDGWHAEICEKRDNEAVPQDRTSLIPHEVLHCDGKIYHGNALDSGYLIRWDNDETKSTVSQGSTLRDLVR